jgi:hypothetical protein
VQASSLGVGGERKYSVEAQRAIVLLYRDWNRSDHFPYSKKISKAILVTGRGGL